MKFSIIVGSLRKNSESARVGDYINSLLIKKGFNSNFTFDLGKLGVPFWDESFGRENDNWNSIWTPNSIQLKESDGIILICPEYGGMASPAIKNLFLLCNKQELSNKPALIVTVSSARGGAYPVSELRSSGYKNTQICYIPEHIIIRDSEKVLKLEDDSPDLDKAEKYLRDRIQYALKVLEAYTIALKPLRDSEVFDYKKYPFGMS